MTDGRTPQLYRPPTLGLGPKNLCLLPVSFFDYTARVLYVPGYLDPSGFGCLFKLSLSGRAFQAVSWLIGFQTKQVQLRGHSDKSLFEQCRADIRKHYFANHVIHDWNRLSQKEIQSIDAFRQEVEL